MPLEIREYSTSIFLQAVDSELTRKLRTKVGLVWNTGLQAGLARQMQPSRRKLVFTVYDCGKHGSFSTFDVPHSHCTEIVDADGAFVVRIQRLASDEIHHLAVAHNTYTYNTKCTYC